MPRPGPRRLAGTIALVAAASMLGGCAALLFAGKVAKTAALVETVVDTARKVARSEEEVPRIAAGQTVTSHLHSSSSVFDDGSFYETWLYRGEAGEMLQIDMASEAFDAYLIFGRLQGGQDGSFQHIASDDDSGEGTDARILVTLTQSGTFAIFANAYEPGSTGVYTLSVTSSRAEDAAAGADATQKKPPALRRF